MVDVHQKAAYEGAKRATQAATMLSGLRGAAEASREAGDLDAYEAMLPTLKVAEIALGDMLLDVMSCSAERRDD